ncbi:2og-fe oxygenase family protein [Ophiostoma piceae UAMH 11346]|uniref:2og-fe oxygenase family protein n=1 Tax=Ophiostoma piceae (strain UAMH 11346) TaxID=1262450 RepID=S3BYS5_OPHP1|nr:2og-fe oxygenase family protein [Ophiostoma piceae UAMH 11346]
MNSCISPASTMSTTVNVMADLVGKISELLSKDKATFSVGGSIPFAAGAGDDSAQHTTSAPVVLRWDPASALAGESRNVVFPQADAAVGQGAEQLAVLLRDCQPASFGRGGEDVFDEEYRKASKLDASAFSSSLCPYALGIVDTVAELLMPSAYMAGGSRGVKAELYKLNVYSAPSGHFKAHVDTPRSEQQFGSLVICLPTPHAGGALVVRHDGLTIRHDWGAGTSLNEGDAAPPALQWAAFYSDCEHEVLEVTAGHRVTLTYNLYSVPQRLQVAGKTEIMDVARLPLYDAVSSTLQNPLFLPEGGRVGYYCRHAYPHSASAPADAPLFPSILKGVDLTFYKVLEALRLETMVRQVLQEGGGMDYYDDDDEYSREDADVHPGVTISRVAKYASGTTFTSVGGHDSYTWDDIRNDYGRAYDVVWLNEALPATGQQGFAHLAYGNEAEIGTLYTYMAIIFKVDKWSDKELEKATA